MRGKPVVFRQGRDQIVGERCRRRWRERDVSGFKRLLHTDPPSGLNSRPHKRYKQRHTLCKIPPSLSREFINPTSRQPVHGITTPIRSFGALCQTSGSRYSVPSRHIGSSPFSSTSLTEGTGIGYRSTRFTKVRRSHHGIGPPRSK